MRAIALLIYNFLTAFKKADDLVPWSVACSSKHDVDRKLRPVVTSLMGQSRDRQLGHFLPRVCAAKGYVWKSVTNSVQGLQRICPFVASDVYICMLKPGRAVQKLFRRTEALVNERLIISLIILVLEKNFKFKARHCAAALQGILYRTSCGSFFP